MRKAFFKKYQLQFKNPVLTSRGEMKVKNGYYLFIQEGEKTGVGECSFIEGLSMDDLENYESSLSKLCKFIESDSNELKPDLALFPSIRFGWECAQLDFENGGRKILFESEFTQGKKRIPINGLVWMGKKDFMLQQIQQKLKEGFKCIKIKVGAIDFDEEIPLLNFIRQKFSADVIELRLDANGAFSEADVFQKLDTLSQFKIHSIEQPVKAGQHELMKKICNSSPIPVALDEELISMKEKEKILLWLNPQYIILKPSLLGGFTVCNEWIQLAEKNNIGWWATSALESNIGLNAIAQWVYTKNNFMAQGLGTGELYSNNISSSLYVSNGNLGYQPDMK